MHVLRALHGRDEGALPELRRRIMPATAAQDVNYRHAYHAGNFADVVKHVALVAILLHLRRKETPFAVIDSHAGRGLYDLTSASARATGEAEGGIGRLHDIEAAPEALDTYLKLVGQSGP